MKLRIEIKNGLILGFIVCLTSLAAFPSQAATYYVATNGDDSHSGASGSPWKTFAHAIPQLQAGDTLILKDGAYTESAYMDCNVNAANGASASPITLRAENERQAWISSDGRFIPIHIRNCSYWNIEGISAKSVDRSTTNGGIGSTITIFKSDHIQVRRNLLVHPNYMVNDHAISIYGPGGGFDLIEENEIYEYKRGGILLQQGESDSIIRRNYLNSRYAASLDGREGIVVYPGSRNIVENNISEQTQNGFGLEANGTTVDNKFLGNIALDCFAGFFSQARADDLGHMNRNAILQNNIVVGSYNGFQMRTQKNAQLTNNSVFNPAWTGFSTDQAPSPDAGDGASSMYVVNALVTPPATGSDFAFSGQSDFACDHCAGEGAFIPGITDSHITNEFISPPTNLGSCYAWIPQNSNLKGAGAGGADIGATILYRYQDGLLTTQPLWNTVTGEFPHGAIIAGINDIPGQSAFDVHQRLNINTNGCSFPAGYGGTSGDTTPPAVSMTAPANGAMVSGSVSVSANASDNVGVVGVQFKLNGSNLGTEDMAAPYSIPWDTTQTANGAYTLTAVARDAAGNVSTSASVLVTVSNITVPPSPTNLVAACNTAGDQVTVSWSASAGATSYYLRLDQSANNIPSCAGGWYCAEPPDYSKDAYSLTSFTGSVTPGMRYDWWVHGANGTGLGPSASGTFTCTSTTVPTVISDILPDVSLDEINTRSYRLDEEITFQYNAPMALAVRYSWDFLPLTLSSKAAAPPMALSYKAMTGVPIATSVPRFTPASHNLAPGRYQVIVTVTSGAQNKTGSATVTLVASNLSGVSVYPNPWRSDRHLNSPGITFDHLPGNATVKLFTAAGHLVKKLTGSGAITWNMRNENGEKAASGIYLYLITSDEGDSKRGKVALIR